MTITPEQLDDLLQALQEAKDTIASQQKEIDRLVTADLEKSIEVEQLKLDYQIAAEVMQKHSAQQREDKTVMANLISKALCEFEEDFRISGVCTSLQVAEDYLTAARWMRAHYERKCNCIEEVQDWVDQYQYKPGPGLFDSFKGLSFN